MSRQTLVAPFTELWTIAARRASALARPVVLSVSERCDPFDPIACFTRTPAPVKVLWYVPRSGEAVVGLSGQRLATTTADRTSTPAPQRLAQAWHHWAAEALWEGPLPPLAFAGWAFDPATPPQDEWWTPFGDGQLILPRLLYRQRGSLAVRTLQSLVDPGAETPPAPPLLALDRTLVPARARPSSVQRHDLVTMEVWREMLRAALAAIARGDLAKVVLARAVELSADRPFDLEAVLQVLAERYPTCTLFAVALGTTVFLGATPERLARVEDKTVHTVALAGSLPRTGDPAADRAALAHLLASAKDRHEHALVVEALRAALEPVCTSLVETEEPTVVSMANVHHLATPISGVLRDGYSALDVAARLHPTPAVGGTPRDAALAFIRAHEPVPRGWYAGALGWVEANGDGELIVGLRSAVVRGSRARLYAGCGIVAGSDPEVEWAEAEAKFQPMLQALAGA